MEQLKASLKGRHGLAVAVYSTPAAEAVLTRHGLSVVDFLRPLSLVNKLNVPMRVGEFSTRVQEVNLRLYAASTMYQPKPEVIDEALRQVLTAQAQRQATLQPAANLIQHVQTEPPESINPWFYGYQAEFLRLVKFTEHEMLDHPVGGLFFMPASTTQPLHFANKLLAEAPLPLQSSQAMLPVSDPLFAKHWVLVQDVGAPDMEDSRALSNLGTLSNTYGAANCSILRLHGSGSSSGSAAAVPASVFQACRHTTLPGGGAGEPEHMPAEPPGGLGHGLSPDDMAAAGQLLRDFAERTLLPRIEERIARLNLTVSTARKGLKNRLTRLWKGAAAEPGPSQEVSYPYHSVEGQMRALADLAYLLGQYEFAVQMYRLAAQDYLAAPNSKWYAGAEEMIGICSILTGDPSADPLKYLNRAFEHYSKARGRHVRMLATRSMMDAAAYQAALGRHLAANMSLMRAHFEEEAARAALLLEAAGYSLLRCRPAASRKAAFHLVLAGLRYHSAKQKRLAIHCYKQVTNIYSASSWRHINEHLHDILGKQCAELGDAQGSLAHCTALLDCGHRQAAAQAHYLARFLEAVQAAGATGPLKDLPLPVVATDSVVVRYADQRCYPPNTPASLLGGSSATAAAAAAGVDGEALAAGSAAAVWEQLEQLLAGGEVPSTNWLDGAKQVLDGEEFNTVAAGEDIGVEVTFKNPLAIKLSLSKVRLSVQFTPAAVGSSSAAQQQQQQHGNEAVDAGTSTPSPDQVLVVESQFSLHPGEMMTETLLLRPATAGWLRVTGVSWLIGSVAEGAAEFDIKGRRRKRPKGDRPSQRKHYPPQRRLLFHVLKGMPRLQLAVDGMPMEAAAGEMLRMQVQLKNVGLLPACNLKVAVSNPGVALAAAAATTQHDAAAAAASSVDVWQQLLGARDVIAPVHKRAVMHRRHQSSGAAFVHQAGSSSAAVAADDQQQHMPHIHSMPAVHEAAAAAAAAGSGSSHAVGGGGSAAGFAGGANDRGQGSAVPYASVFQIGAEDMVLQPGQSLSIPMWVHVEQSGRFSFQCAWFCEPQVSVSATMRHRVLLTQHSLAVSGLLDLASPSVSPCVKDLHCYNLRLQATASKESPGVLTLHQLSCLSAGCDAGWRMRSFSGGTFYDASGGWGGTSSDSSLQLSLHPGLRLGAGESLTHFVQLVSPAASPAGSQAAVAASGSGSAELLPVQQGPLHYFYKRGVTGAGSQAGGGSSGGSGVAAAAAALQQPLPLLPAEVKPQVSEPPVDLLVLWRSEQQSAGSGSSLPPDSNTPQQQQQQQQQRRQRAGFIAYYDLCAALQLNPVRMTLDRPGLRAPHKHDFRAASLCIVPLTLTLRNCGTASVSLTVRASGAWEGLSADHAWWATPTPPGSKLTGLLGSSAAAAAAAAGAASSSGGSPAAAGTAAATPQQQQQAAYGPLSGGAAGLSGLPPRPRTPQAAAAGVSGIHLGGVAGEGLGSVFSGLGVRGSSPMRGAAADGSTGSSSSSIGRDAPGQAGSGGQQQLGGPATADSAALQAGLPPSAEHVWCGVTCVPVQHLEPGGSVEVVLQVAVFKPGVYVLDDYGIDWRCEGVVGPGGRVRQGSKVGEAIVLKVDAA